MKNILIVGASSGIGLALSKQLAQEGQQVYATYNTHPIETPPPNTSVHQLDVLQETLTLDFLPPELHGMVYCPGSINLLPFHRLKPETFTKDYQLQVVGAIKVLQSVLNNLKASGSASVVLFSTVAVQMGFNFHTQVSASKGALEGLTRALAAELAPTVRINSIAPSLTQTPLAGKLLSTPEKVESNVTRHPMKRIGRPEDIAAMAAFLLSEKSSWITGQIMHVDGGISAVKG